jgi:hypothetical protein
MKIMKTNVIILFLMLLISISSVDAAYNCGNGVCERHDGENTDNCPADCVVVCGDGDCLSGENANNCPEDCQPECGNAAVESGEECDNGSENADTEADHCRTNCILHYCGDAVADSDEECDSNSLGDTPNNCREDCTMPYCGDGIVDDDYLYGDFHSNSPESLFNEECDDGNNDDNDGCTNDCKACLPVHDDLFIYEDPGLPLCEGEYTLTDAGEPGIIQVQGFNFDLDCNNAVLIGASETMVADSISPNIPGGAMQQIGGGGTDPAATRPNDNSEPEDTSTATSPDIGDQYTLKRGIGIIVRGNSILLKNCDVRNFNKGIKFENGGNMLFQSKSCGNTVDVASTGYGNFGVLNQCDRAVNWFENGNTCKTGCDGELNTVVPAPDCPACECQEEALEETEEEVEEEGGFFSKIVDFILGNDNEEKMKEPLIPQDDEKSGKGSDDEKDSGEESTLLKPRTASDEKQKSDKIIDTTLDKPKGDDEIEEDETPAKETTPSVSRYATSRTPVVEKEEPEEDDEPEEESAQQDTAETEPINTSIVVTAPLTRTVNPTPRLPVVR